MFKIFYRPKGGINKRKGYTRRKPKKRWSGLSNHKILGSRRESLTKGVLVKGVSGVLT